MLANRLFREPIEPPRFRVSFDLPIPGIIEIHLGQAFEELGLLLLRQLFYRFDDFTHRAHVGNLAEIFPGEKREERMKEERPMKNEGI
jgi:hypothetical protein